MYGVWELGDDNWVTVLKQKTKKMPLGYIAHLRSIFPWNAHFEKNYNFTRNRFEARILLSLLIGFSVCLIPRSRNRTYIAVH